MQQIGVLSVAKWTLGRSADGAGTPQSTFTAQ
jgi:hypothetical protein